MASKGKIISLSNTKDSKWYRFKAEDLTLELLDSVFDIYDNLYEEDENLIYSYKYKTKLGDSLFLKETSKFIAYFILTKDRLHLILRKTLKWKDFDKKIDDIFEFDKTK